MQFRSPELLWLLLGLPVLVGIYILAQRRRTRFPVRYSSLTLVKDALGQGSRYRRHIPPLFFLLGVASMLFALARPVGVVVLPKDQATVILALDVSRSMSANDLKPSRIEAAKTAARDFIARQDANTRIGIVSFSSYAALVQEPTTDRNLLIAAVNRLSVQNSTAIGSAILVSLDAIFENPGANPTAQSNGVLAPETPEPTPVPIGMHLPGTIVLLTDGQNRTGPSPIEAARTSANRGIRIFAIGIGTPNGATMADPNNRGFGFRAALDEETLRQIASITDGKYFNATDETALATIYQNLSKDLTLQTEQEENTVVFTAAAMGCLVLSLWLSLFWLKRLP